jgi:hypothetical protein
VRPAPERDRPHFPKLAAVALAGFALGVGAAVWNAGGQRTPWPAAPLAPAPSSVPAAIDPEAPGTPPAMAVIADHDAGVAVPVAVVAELDAGPAVTPAVPFSDARRLEPGRVAYLRCDGVPQLPGPYPCARDEALETAVWAVLDTLPRCADAPPGLGESDIRVELVAGAPPDVKLRAPRPGVPRLDGPAILRCAAGPLSHVTTSTRATRLVLSFRFALVDARQPRVP